MGRTATPPPASGSLPAGETLVTRHALPIRLSQAASWLAWRSSNRWVSLGLVAAIVLIDLVLLRHPFGFVARALMDEPCHLATALIVLGTITRWRGRPPGVPFTWAMLVASVAIDIDHLPSELAARGLLYGNLPRPYTHALWLPLLLAVIAVAAARRARPGGRGGAATVAAVFAGASWGLAAHFFRDLATAPISLLWPVTGSWLEMPYGWYLGPLILLAILPASLPFRLRG